MGIGLSLMLAAGCGGRSGDGEVPGFSSALPSRERERRNCRWEDDVGGGRTGAEDEEHDDEGAKGSSLRESSAPPGRPKDVVGVDKALPGFQRLAR